MKAYISIVATLVASLFFCQNTYCQVEHFQSDGIIYSSEGGYMFPDKSIQKTAAKYVKKHEAANPRGIGYITFDGLNLGIDSGNYVSLIPIYSFSMIGDLPDSIALLGGIRSRTSAQFQSTKVCLDIGSWTPKLWESYAQRKRYSTIKVYLTRSLPNEPVFYFEYDYTNSTIHGVHDQLIYLGADQFAHMECIRFDAEEFKWSYFNSSGNTVANWILEEGVK